MNVILISYCSYYFHRQWQNYIIIILAWLPGLTFLQSSTVYALPTWNTYNSHVWMKAKLHHFIIPYTIFRIILTICIASKTLPWEPAHGWSPGQPILQCLNHWWKYKHHHYHTKHTIHPTNVHNYAKCAISETECIVISASQHLSHYNKLPISSAQISKQPHLLSVKHECTVFTFLDMRVWKNILWRY